MPIETYHIFIFGALLIAVIVMVAKYKRPKKPTTTRIAPTNIPHKIIDHVRYEYGEGTILKEEPLPHGNVLLTIRHNNRNSDYKYKYKELYLDPRENTATRHKIFIVKGSKEHLNDPTQTIKQLTKKINELEQEKDQQEDKETIRKANQQQEAKEVIEMIKEAMIRKQEEEKRKETKW